MDRPPQSTLPQVDPLHPLYPLEWRECQRMPVCMYHVQAVVLRDKVYMYGRVHVEIVDPLFSDYNHQILNYEFTTDTWKCLKSPTNLSAFTTYMEKLVLVGGRDPSTYTPSKQLWVIDPEDEQTWTQPLPPMPTPRLGASAAAIQYNLIVAGGLGSRVKALNVVEMFNGWQWVVAQSLPRPCSEMKSAIYNGNWYLVGGYGQDKEVFCCSLESVVASAQSKVTKRVWKTLAEVPHKWSSAAVWKGYLIAVGGFGPSSDILFYHHPTQSWVKVGDCPVGRDSTCTIVLPTEELLMVGGRGTGGDSDRVFKGSLKGLYGVSKREEQPSQCETILMLESVVKREEQLLQSEAIIQMLKERVAKTEDQLLQSEETIRMYKELHREQGEQMELAMAENKLLRKYIYIAIEEALVPAGESTIAGCLRGVDVIGETSVSVTNEAQIFHWAGYGLKLHIPPASLPAGVGQSSIDIKASLAGHFNFPENTTLVSAAYWLHSPVEFSQPIPVEIQHCVTPSDDPSITFARASREEPPYTFTALEGGLFPTDSSYACIQLNRFSLVAIIQKLWSLLTPRQPERQYCAQVYYTKETENTWKAYFVVTHNLEASVTTVREKYSKALAGPELDVIFEDKEIVLQVPNEGVIINDNWTITPLAYPKVAKKMVDSFESGGRLPSCQLRIKRMGNGRQEGLEYMVKLKGAKQPSDFFLIALECEATPKDVSPPYQRTSVRSRHQYTSEVSHNPAGPSISKDEDVSLPVQRSSGKRSQEYTAREGAGAEEASSDPKRPRNEATPCPAELRAEPELPDLMNIVAAQIPSKWRLVGIQLHLKDSELDGIEVTSDDPLRCFSSVFTLWKRKETRLPLSWWTVLQALEAASVDEQRLTRQVRSKLTTPSHD